MDRPIERSGIEMSAADVIFLILFFLVPSLLFLLPILGVGFFIWYVLRRRVRNVNQSLGKLAGVVNGTMETGTLLPRARLTGTHEGVPVEARLQMNRQGFIHGAGEPHSQLVYTSADDLGSGGYLYELSTGSDAGGRGWSAVRGTEGEASWHVETGYGNASDPPPQEGVEASSWHIKTEDEALRQRLLGSGALAALQNLSGYPGIVRYGAGRLWYRSRLDSLDDVPDPDRFRAQLGAFTDLAEINRQVNVG
jgi:hypothetical protein